jgi:hypothetical protein
VKLTVILTLFAFDFLCELTHMYVYKGKKIAISILKILCASVQNPGQFWPIRHTEFLYPCYMNMCP